MTKLAFLLGAQPDLATREVLATATSLPLLWNSSMVGSEVVLLNADSKASILDASVDGLPSQELLALLDGLQRRLGGVRKIAWLVEQCPVADTERVLVDVALRTWGETTRSLAVSVVGGSDAKHRPQPLRQAIAQALLKKSVKARYVDVQEGRELSTAQTYGNRLALVTSKEGVQQRGREYLVIVDGDICHVGLIATVQDIAEYSRRDLDLPMADAFNGLLPVKLAQLMVNLAAGDRDTAQTVIYDPCCGNSRIPIEASAMGFAALASDNSDLQVFHSQANLEWWAERSNTALIPLKLLDATSEEAVQWAQENAAGRELIICTEPWLGTPVHTKFTSEKIQVWEEEVTGLYEQLVQRWFGGKQAVLAGMLLTVPTPQLGDGSQYMALVERVTKLAKKLGYQVEVEGTYARPDTYIGRTLVWIER